MWRLTVGGGWRRLDEPQCCWCSVVAVTGGQLAETSGVSNVAVVELDNFVDWAWFLLGLV